MILISPFFTYYAVIRESSTFDQLSLILFLRRISSIALYNRLNLCLTTRWPLYYRPLRFQSKIILEFLLLLRVSLVFETECLWLKITKWGIPPFQVSLTPHFLLFRFWAPLLLWLSYLRRGKLLQRSLMIAFF